MAFPALRYVDAFPVDQGGQPFICLRDPEGIVERQIVLTHAAFFIASHLDGQRDIHDLQRLFAAQSGGQALAPEAIHQLVHHLDQHGFLLTDNFETLRQHVETTFLSATVRPAYLAGKSYPKDARPLRAFLDNQFTSRADGPGELPGPGHSTRSHPDTRSPTRCLIAPHIDYHRGGHAYAHAYLHLFKQGRPDVVIIFGVAHVSPPAPFILTQKDFATPFGVLQTDRDLVKKLEAACSWDPYVHEIVHRTEHSIEFQAVMLAYLFGPTVRIVPILCGTFGSEYGTVAPADINPVATFLDTCQEVVDGLGNRISVIAGADLAHVGRRFGDAFEISDRIVRNVNGRDREDLHYVTAGNADGFYQSVMQDQNQRRICGLNCIYASLKTVE